MTKSDDKILEVLEKLTGATTIRGIEVNSELWGIRVPYSTAKGRIPRLINAGLIRTVDQHEQWYMITEEGSAYLAGDHVPPDLD